MSRESQTTIDTFAQRFLCVCVSLNLTTSEANLAGVSKRLAAAQHRVGIPTQSGAGCRMPECYRIPWSTTDRADIPSVCTVRSHRQREGSRFTSPDASSRVMPTTPMCAEFRSEVRIRKSEVRRGSITGALFVFSTSGLVVSVRSGPSPSRTKVRHAAQVA